MVGIVGGKEGPTLVLWSWFVWADPVQSSSRQLATFLRAHEVEAPFRSHGVRELVLAHIGIHRGCQVLVLLILQRHTQIRLFSILRLKL